MSTLQILSGLGVKGPACLRLNTGRQTWILDCGHGPEDDACFDPSWLHGADAVFITHDHIDHIGGAAHVLAAGLPIYVTEQTAKSLPEGADLRILPERGTLEIDGLRLTVGRNGHALGGVWFHFDVGDGLFYSGDWSEESDWFALDLPPAAKTAVLDCSYQLDTTLQNARLEALERLLQGLPGQVLLPVPPSGRAGELALHLLRRFGPEAVRLDAVCRAVLKASLASGALAPAAKEIAPLLDCDDMQSARFLICDTPNADAGEACAFVQNWRDAGRLGRDAHVVFTGYLTSHARSIVSEPGGYFCRWNVHPPLGDQIRMLRRLGATGFVPAFCEAPHAYAERTDLGAKVLLKESIAL